MSRKSRSQFFSRQNTERNRRARSIAMNAAMMSEQSGMGGWQDRSVGERPTINQFANPFVYSNNQLFAARYAWILHESDWMAQKIVDIPVFDMFREGWDWEHKGEDNGIDKALEDECRRLQFVPMLCQAKKMERLVGGCVAIRITREREGEKADTREPLLPEQVERGGILGYNVVAPIHISRVEWEMDPAKPDYGRPRYYYIRDHIYHRSRLVIFDGQPISPFPQQDFAAYAANWNGFGLSKLAPIWDVIMRANSYQQGASHLSSMASVWFALYKGLRDIKMTRQGNKALEEMRDIMETMSSYKAVILDGEDVDVKSIGAQFGSVPELLMSGLQIVCAAADIPASRFLGQAPGGLSTDDRSGLENYYNDIAARQRMELDPILDSEKRYLLNSALGAGVADPEEISQEWAPLWNLSDTEKAQVRTLDANNVANLVNTLGFNEEWAVDELLRREVITVKPDLEAMALKRASAEVEAFGQALAGHDGAAADDAESEDGLVKAAGVGGGMPRMPGMGARLGGSLPRLSALNAWDESKHPRADDGKFGEEQGGDAEKELESPSKGGKPTATSPEEKQKKIDSVKIDFDRDNTLPGLNAEDLAELGKADKPVLLKKGIIEKNMLHHPDVLRDDYATIIGQSLYNPDGIFPGSSSEPRFNFMSRVGPNKSTITLLEMAENKGNYEIINLHMVKDRQRKQKER